jgi:hypothetical protein
MALATSSAFSSFDQSANVNTLDISSFLSEALIYDFSLLGALNIDLSDPVDDIIHYWQEDSLNSEQLTLAISLSTTASSLTITASTAPHVGDYIVAKDGGTNGNGEVMQVTTVNSSTSVSVSRGFNTTAASVPSGGTMLLMRAEQEFSDIGTDASVNPTVRSNYTHIIPGRDLQLSGSQLARNMATTALQNQVAHQLENRMKEWKRDASRIFLYSERIGPGSDTQYRTLGGLRYWIRTASGQTEATAGALSLTYLNTVNKLIVDQGEYPDTLVIGTDLVNSVNAIEATNRRLLESDRKVGYMVNQVVLGQGNAVDVVVDTRVGTGDAFLVCKDKLKARPLNGRAMITIAGQDWLDGKKRRILGEWGVEVRNPSVAGYLSNKT